MSDIKISDSKLQKELPKVGFASLGCPKNQCDAELMLSKIANAGYPLVSEVGEADVVIINTCAFIQSAKEEAIEEILEAASRKADGINKHIIITGCLSERYKNELEDEFPEVDGILCLSDNKNIVKAIETVTNGERFFAYGDISGHCMEGERLISTLPHYAYLRVADGCNNCCSYCAIPSFRGRYRSRKIEDIVNEAGVLAQNGVRELILVAQDVTNYGMDLYGEIKLPELLRELSRFDKIKWIRLLYCYPQRITDELIETIKAEDKIVKYLDLPIQHCNDDILKQMNRGDDKRSLVSLISKLRKSIEGLVLRTTVITGFPGESYDQFTELAEFVDEISFEHLGCFAYCEEEGTAASKMQDQVDVSERERRKEVIMEQQEVRVSQFLNSNINKTFEVVVEGVDRYANFNVDDNNGDEESFTFFGRNYMFAPEIDQMIYFPAKSNGDNPKVGDFVNVKIVEVIDNILVGVMV